VLWKQDWDHHHSDQQWQQNTTKEEFLSPTEPHALLAISLPCV
jgi:hypothetical protein